MLLGINVVMDPPKRRNWAEDESDEWEEEEVPPTPPKPVLVEQRIRPAPTREAQLQGEPPFILDVCNLPFALDSEAKVLPYLVSGLPSHDLVFRPFRECPRGCVKVTTHSAEVAKHILSLDGSEETGRLLRIRQAFQDRHSGGHGPKSGGRKPHDRRERNEGGRGPPPARLPPRPIPPAVIENKNAEYSRKDPPPVISRAKVEETKSEPITPAVVAPVQPPKPRVDPFGGAKPIDTRSKDLEFEEKVKKDPASPTKRPVEPKSAGVKPMKAGSGDIKAIEHTPSDHPQTTELKEEPSKPEPQAQSLSIPPTQSLPIPPVQVEIRPVPEIQPVVEKPKIEQKLVDTKPPSQLETTAEVKSQEAKAEIQPQPKVSQAPPQEPPVAEADWDFSEPGTESRVYQPEYHRYQRRSRVLTTQRYVRTGKMRSDRAEIPPSATPPLSFEEKKEEPPPKPRKRAWTSVEEDREVLAQPPVLPDPKGPDPPRGFRGQRPRGRGR